MPQPRRPDQRPTDQRPTVPLVNPNSSPATTASMTVLAEEALRPSGLRVRGLTAPAGPSMIVDEVALAAAAGHVVDAVEGDLRSGGAPMAVGIAAIVEPVPSACALVLAGRAGSRG